MVPTFDEKEEDKGSLLETIKYWALKKKTVNAVKKEGSESMKDEYLTNLFDSANEAMGRIDMSTNESQGVKVAAIVAIGVTAVAGVAAAAAFSGYVFYSQGKSLKLSWERKPKKPHPLSPDQWRKAFEADEKRLKGGGERVIGRIRKGGVDPNIRHEVWPFLLGLYDANSSGAEREAKRKERRDKYEGLREEVKVMAEKVRVEEKRLASLQAAEEENAARVRAAGEARKKREERAILAASAAEARARMNTAELDGPEAASRSIDCSSEKPPATEEDVKPVLGQSSGVINDNKRIEGGWETLDDYSKRGESSANASSKEESLGPSEVGCKAAQDFGTWQHIMRLDAVRMNAAWIPYSVQGEVSAEEATAAAELVKLRDDGHLEPARQHHAARLVSILEAYAVLDPEIGYCQGMSDLLSPFVALMESDSEAFWCYESFMRKVRHNFRVDEVGIQKQLTLVSSIVAGADPALFTHLKSIQADDCIFVYRMLVVLLRRELSFEQTLCLWEVIWADSAAAAAADAVAASVAAVGGSVVHTKADIRAAPTKELLLYVIAAIVTTYRREIMQCTAMDEVLRLCNSFANNLDVWNLVDVARDMVQALGDIV